MKELRNPVNTTAQLISSLIRCVSYGSRLWHSGRSFWGFSKASGRFERSPGIYHPIEGQDAVESDFRPQEFEGKKWVPFVRDCVSIGNR